MASRAGWPCVLMANLHSLLALPDFHCRRFSLSARLGLEAYAGQTQVYEQRPHEWCMLPPDRLQARRPRWAYRKVSSPAARLNRPAYCLTVRTCLCVTRFWSPPCHCCYRGLDQTRYQDPDCRNSPLLAVRVSNRRTDFLPVDLPLRRESKPLSEALQAPCPFTEVALNQGRATAELRSARPLNATRRQASP